MQTARSTAFGYVIGERFVQILLFSTSPSGMAENMHCQKRKWRAQSFQRLEALVVINGDNAHLNIAGHSDHYQLLLLITHCSVWRIVRDITHSN